jgi:integrase
MVQRYMADKSASRKADGTPTWSPKTINGTMVPLREMLGHAVEWGYLDANPAASVRPLRVEPREREILTPAELAAVLEAAEGPHALMFRIAALLGLRRGELLGLRWGDLELDQRRLHVRQTYTNTGFGSPKSRAGRRVVPLTPGLVAELRRHRLAAPANPHDLVFASSAGTPIDPRNLVTAWHRALRRAGVRMLAFHSLRHTAVSLVIASEGLNPKQLQSVIGHASIQLTYDTYGHLMPDSFEGFGSGLDAALRGHGGVTGEDLATTA